MKVVVINGSPKGEYSITLQTLLYIQKKFPQCDFVFHHVGSRIRAYERDMSGVLADLADADLLLFSYPVYTFLVPSQLHRFVELLCAAVEEGRIDLRGRYVSQVTTSKHFYDVTAHTFIRENMQDLGMCYVKGLSADMSDLTTEAGQRQARDFFRYVCWCRKKGYCEEEDARRREAVCPASEDGSTENGAKCASSEMVPKVLEPGSQVCDSTFAVHAADSATCISDYSKSDSAALPAVIVTDCTPADEELAGMIRSFREKLALPSVVYNLRDYEIKGGCLGCLRCAATGQCIYKDEYQELLRQVHSGCGIVYAFRIRNHSMGSLFKTFDDRQFCNGHRTVTMGSPVGYLVCGDYAEESNLRMVIEARAETGGNFFAGAASCEAQVCRVAETFCYAVRHRYAPPSNFYGVGGMKIFRDLIYEMRGFMKADHEFFKTHGQYDFPHKNKGNTALMYVVGAMMSSEKMRKKIGNKMNEGMLAPYRKVLEEE